MMDDNESERFLTEVFSEGRGASIEKDCLAKMLQSLKRERRSRRLKRRSSVFVFVLLGCLLVGQYIMARRKSLDPCEIVTTQKLPASAWAMDERVSGVSGFYVESRPSAIPVRGGKREYTSIGDGELFALLAPDGGAVLLRVGPGTQKLVLVDSTN